MTTSPAPMWLIDFDGVVNALSRRGGRSFWDDWRTAAVPHPEGELTRRGDVVQLPLLWSRTVVDTIAHAANSGIDVRWLSTWREHTRLLPPVLHGLPDLPWLDENILDPDAADDLDPRDRMVSGPWKVAVAKAAVPDDAPLLWTEDELRVDMLSEAWRRSRSASTTYIRPNPLTGLIRRDIAAIRAWIDEHAPR